MSPNICFIVLDAVRTGNLSYYGHSRSTTPTIDRVIENNPTVVFENAHSPTGVTIDSIASLFSGLYPVEHQSGKAGKLQANVPLLPERIREAGYQTGAITCNPFISEAFGFGRGFDTIQAITQRFSEGINLRKFYSETKHLPRHRRYLRFLRAALTDHPIASLGNALQFRFDLFGEDDDGARKATESASQFFDQTAETDPWFLYLHYTETHMNSTNELPYSIPEGERFRFVEQDEADFSSLETQTMEVDYDDQTIDLHERLYDAALRYLDGQLRLLFDDLKARGCWDDTLLIITADHGECLGEHGHLGHGTLYEPGIKVPLILKLPGGYDISADHISARVNTLHLFPTILAIADLPVPEHLRENPNLLLNQPPVTLAQDYSNTWDWSRYKQSEVGVNAIYENEFKLITWPDSEELYHLTDDPSEQTDRGEDFPEKIAELRNTLDSRLASMLSVDSKDGQELDITETTEQRLQDLGYM